MLVNGSIHSNSPNRGKRLTVSATVTITAAEIRDLTINQNMRLMKRSLSTYSCS